jgi:DNA repair protein RecO (recombination protein O)
MPQVRTEALILQSYAYSETSKVLRLLTRSHGLVSALARGAIRPRSPFGGLLEPFTAGVAMLYIREGRELQTLSGFELSRSGHGLARDLIRFAAASLMAELILRTGADIMAETSLFDAFDHGLFALADATPDNVQNVALACCWNLVVTLGYAPALECCANCGCDIGEVETVDFDYIAGGVCCARCGRGAAGRAIPATARQALIRLCRGEAVPLDRTVAHWKLLQAFLVQHLTDGVEIRSFHVLNSVLAPI